MARMNAKEHAKYKKKWETFKKKVFLTLEKGNIKSAMEEIEAVKDDPEFLIVPEIPEESMETPGSPINETLVLLAHKRIFFSSQKTAEESILEIEKTRDISTFTEKQKEFISYLKKEIQRQKEQEKEESLLKNEEYSNLDKNGNIIYKDVFGEDGTSIIPHFATERMDAIPVIERLINLGADPLSWVGAKGQFYHKMLALDNEQVTKYILDKIPDNKLTEIDRSGLNILGYILAERAEKTFNIIVKEKEDIFNFKEVFLLGLEQNLLHLSMGNYMPEATAFLINKNTSLTQRNLHGKYPADIIPNNEIAFAREQTKNVIRKDNEILKVEELQPFIPSDFKPHKEICSADDFYNEMAGLTKLQLTKERELAKTQIKRFRTEF